MKGIILTIRIVAVRLAFAIARLLPLRSRVVLATAHSARLAGNLVSIRDDLAARHPESRWSSSRAGRRVDCAAGSPLSARP